MQHGPVLEPDHEGVEGTAFCTDLVDAPPSCAFLLDEPEADQLLEPVGEQGGVEPFVGLLIELVEGDRSAVDQGEEREAPLLAEEIEEVQHVAADADSRTTADATSTGTAARSRGFCPRRCHSYKTV